MNMPPQRDIALQCLPSLPSLLFPPMVSFPLGIDVPKISFSKYHGIGNDFILIDNRQSDKPILSAEQCKEVDRKGGREEGKEGN